MEPVAAAHYYESTLDHDELILLGAFGGGTSDFSLVRVGPTVRRRGRVPGDIVGNAGVGIAGDSFDAKIIWAPSVSGSWIRIAVALAGQDPDGSKLGLYQARALAPSVPIKSQ
jgi:hypothetical protein